MERMPFLHLAWVVEIGDERRGREGSNLLCVCPMDDETGDNRENKEEGNSGFLQATQATLDVFYQASGVEEKGNEPVLLPSQETTVKTRVLTAASERSHQNLNFATCLLNDLFQPSVSISYR
ncbi:hypothetical protein H920_04826 [Fukomys damarensis]|uniref:Uncharacterized protein n=1 Tax=Fukomys damarensis TaxID=885580 RepID=A0A091DRW8_FUKDA|nr:hypothetical protein H920_04826 [Fukomys damarensis]